MERCIFSTYCFNITFFDKTFDEESLVKNPSKRYVSTNNFDLRDIINTLHKIEPTPLRMEGNIDEKEKNALQELKLLSKTSIEIKKADKSDTWLIMDKTLYRDNLVLKEHLLTPTYEKAHTNANKKVYVELKKLVKKHSFWHCVTCL